MKGISKLRKQRNVSQLHQASLQFHRKCNPIFDIDDPANLGHPHPSHFSHEACGPSLKSASSSLGLTQKTTRFTSITLPPPDPNGGPPPKKKLSTLPKRNERLELKMKMLK